jgi:hypothetical protein
MMQVSEIAENKKNTLDEPSQICPECHQNWLVKSNGELVCIHCGFVCDEERSFNPNLPFDETFAFESKLAFGRSLGGTLPHGQLSRVIARSSNGSKDLPIRAIHLKTIVESVEPPQAMKLKAEISGLLKRYGLYGEDYNEFNHLLGDKAGHMAETVARFLQAGRAKPLSNYRRLAAAIVLSILRECDGKFVIICADILENEKPSDYDVATVNCIMGCPLLNLNVWTDS